MGESTGTPTKKAAAKSPVKPEPDVDAALLAQQAIEEKKALADEERAAAERDEPALASNLGKLEVLKRLFMHSHAGEDFPSDEELLELEDELLAPPAAPAVAEVLPVDGLPPGVAALLEQQAAQTAALMQGLSDMAERFAVSQATGNAAQEGLTGSVEELVKQMAGTVSDGGDGENPYPTPITFISKGKSQLVVKKARHRQVGADGSQSFTNGIAADFAPTGSYSTRNREMVAYLRARPGMNVLYWELGKEPHAVPSPKVVMGEIMRAVLALDDAKLGEMQQVELAGHKRQAVLDAIESARDQIQGFQDGGE